MAINKLKVDELFPHPDNPRKELGDLTEMVDSVKKNGILQNLTVVPGHRLTKEEWIASCKAEGVSKENALMTYDGEARSPEGFTVIIGHRRLAAAKLAGLETVPCHIALDMPEDEQFAVMMMENMQRVDLTPIEQIEGMQYMLDLGFTEQEIQKKTGFSQKTVKDRLKVAQLKLDKDEWKAAEGRGGTIAEYLSLEKVKDPEKRAELLKAVGTRDFNLKLSVALDAQKEAERRTKLLADLAEFAEKAEFNWGKYDSVKMFYPSQQNETVRKPADADEVKYYYDESSYMIRLFKEKTDPEETETETEDQKKKQILNEWNDEMTAKLDEIRDRFFELRVNFVKNLTEGEVKKNSFQIYPFASKAMIGELQAFWVGAARDTKKEFFKVIKKKNGDTELDQEAFKETSRAKPYWTLLASTLCAFDAKGNKTHTTEWDESCQRHLKYERSKGLEAAYELLEAFGYEMSEDEEMYMTGEMMKAIMEKEPK